MSGYLNKTKNQARKKINHKEVKKKYKKSIEGIRYLKTLFLNQIFDFFFKHASDHKIVSVTFIKKRTLHMLIIEWIMIIQLMVSTVSDFTLLPESISGVTVFNDPECTQQG
jgi:hypothetical protein